MLRCIQPVQFLLRLLASCSNCRQLDVIEYLREENRLLKEYALGRKALSELDTLGTADTLMLWYRTLVRAISPMLKSRSFGTRVS